MLLQGVVYCSILTLLPASLAFLGYHLSFIPQGGMCLCRVHPEEHEAGQAWRSKAGKRLAGAVQRGQLGKLECLVSVSGLLVRTLPWVKKG